MLDLASRTRYAPSGDLRIAYEMRGVAARRRPALLLIQGLGFGRAGWAGRRARYAGSFRQRRIRARTLILHGTADRVVDPRNARLLASRIEDAELVTFPGLGHLFFWEDPGAFAAAVTAFLRGPRDRRQGRRMGRRPHRARAGH